MNMNIIIAGLIGAALGGSAVYILTKVGIIK
jgi:hypothetical protein